MILRLFLAQALACFCACLAFAGSTEERAEELDHVLAALVAPRPLAAVALSSDGRYLAGLVAGPKLEGYDHAYGPRRLKVWRTADNPLTGAALPIDTGRLRWMAWAGSGRLLVSLARESPKQSPDLQVYDARTQQLRPLIAKGERAPEVLEPVLLSAMIDTPDTVLLQWEERRRRGYPAAYRVNVVSGEVKKVVSAWSPILRWYASPEGVVSLGEGYQDGKQKIFGRTASGGWKAFSERDRLADPALQPLYVESGGRTVVALSSHASDTRALWRMTTADGTFLKRLAGHERFDMSAALISPATHLVQGARYVGERPEAIYLDQAADAAAKAVTASLGVKAALLEGASRDGGVSLYRTEGVGGQRGYALYAEGGEPRWVQKPAPLPFARASTEMIWTDLPESAGRMHMLVTRPPEGMQIKGGIVRLHGGPVRRVHDRFRPLSQWLAQNGFVVVEPNFRGSAGYGDAWRRAGYGEWGQAMQRDVATAAKWLQARLPDGANMCAIGGSYGGYAALMSVIQDYDLFRCAASWNGVTSLPLYLRELNRTRFSRMVIPRVKGALSTRQLKALSPTFAASRVRRPVHIAFGTEDDTIMPAHSKSMIVELARYRKRYEDLAIEGADHALTRAHDKALYYSDLLSFLEKWIAR